MDSFYQSFSSLFTNHLEVHSRQTCIMLLRKRSMSSSQNSSTNYIRCSCEYRFCRCLARIAITAQYFGQISIQNFQNISTC